MKRLLYWLGIIKGVERYYTFYLYTTNSREMQNKLAKYLNDQAEHCDKLEIIKLEHKVRPTESKVEFRVFLILKTIDII